MRTLIMILPLLLFCTTTSAQTTGSMIAECDKIIERFPDDADGLKRAAELFICVQKLAEQSADTAARLTTGPNAPPAAMDFQRPNQYGPGWSTYSEFRNFEYAKNGEGMVLLRGMMSGCPSKDHPIFVLPAGYRPSIRLIFSSIGGVGNERARVDVTSDGSVHFWWSAETSPCPSPPGTGPMWLSMEGLMFEAER